MNAQTLVEVVESELDGAWTNMHARPESTAAIVINDDVNPMETGGTSGSNQC